MAQYYDYFNGPSTTAETNSSRVTNVSVRQSADYDDIGSRTIVVQAGVTPNVITPAPESSSSQPVFQRAFDEKGRVSVGREADNDIQLDALVISNHHARFMNTAQGIVVQDAGSTNGVYLNGSRVAGWSR